MLGAYREIYSLPGAAAFSLTGVLARFPFSMLTLGVILLVRDAYGSYTTAGTVSAGFVAGIAVGGPLLARLVDRYGQSRVMRPSSVISGLSSWGLVVASWYLVHPAVLVGVAALAGLFAGSMGALVRARWSLVARTPRQLHTAFSLESALDEIGFILGPVLATWLATSINGWSAVAIGATLQVIGSLAFLAQTATEPPAGGAQHRSPAGSDDRRRGGVLAINGVALTVLVMVLLGVAFAANDLAIVSFAEEAGDERAAGLVLAVFAAGSLIAGFVYGARAKNLSPARNLLVGLVILAVGEVALLLAPTLLLLALCAFVTGLAIAPSIINANAVVQRVVPPGRLTEGLAWVSTGINVGTALGGLLAGRLIDEVGSFGGFAAAAGAAAAAVLAAALVLASVRRVH